MTATQIVFTIVFPAIFALATLAVTVVLFMALQDQIRTIREEIQTIKNDVRKLDILVTRAGMTEKV